MHRTPLGPYARSGLGLLVVNAILLTILNLPVVHPVHAVQMDEKQMDKEPNVNKDSGEERVRYHSIYLVRPEEKKPGVLDHPQKSKKAKDERKSESLNPKIEANKLNQRRIEPEIQNNVVIGNKEVGAQTHPEKSTEAKIQNKIERKRDAKAAEKQKEENKNQLSKVEENQINSRVHTKEEKGDTVKFKKETIVNNKGTMPSQKETISIATWNIQPANERTTTEGGRPIYKTKLNVNNPFRAGQYKYPNLDKVADRIEHYANVGRALVEVAVDNVDSEADNGNDSRVAEGHMRVDKADFVAVQEYGEPESDGIYTSEGYASHVNTTDASQAQNPVRVLAREHGYGILRKRGNRDYNDWYAVHLLYDEQKWEKNKDFSFQVKARSGGEKRPCQGGFFTRKASSYDNLNFQEDQQPAQRRLPKLQSPKLQSALVVSCHLPHCNSPSQPQKTNTCRNVRANLETHLEKTRAEIQQELGHLGHTPGSYAEFIAGDFNEFGSRKVCRVGTEENHETLYQIIGGESGQACLKGCSSPEDEYSVFDRTLDWGFDLSEPADRILYRAPQAAAQTAIISANEQTNSELLGKRNFLGQLTGFLRGQQTGFFRGKDDNRSIGNQSRAPTLTPTRFKAYVTGATAVNNTFFENLFKLWAGMGLENEVQQARQSQNQNQFNLTQSQSQHGQRPRQKARQKRTEAQQKAQHEALATLAAAAETHPVLGSGVQQRLVKYNKNLAQTRPVQPLELSDHRPRRVWLEVN